MCARCGRAVCAPYAPFQDAPRRRRKRTHAQSMCEHTSTGYCSDTLVPIKAALAPVPRKLLTCEPAGYNTRLQDCTTRRALSGSSGWPERLTRSSSWPLPTMVTVEEARNGKLGSDSKDTGLHGAFLVLEQACFWAVWVCLAECSQCSCQAAAKVIM